MNWRVVNREPAPQLATLLLAKGVHQRLPGVSAQIVHYQMDGFRLRILIGDRLDKARKFRRRAGRCDLRDMHSRRGSTAQNALAVPQRWYSLSCLATLPGFIGIGSLTAP